MATCATPVMHVWCFNGYFMLIGYYMCLRYVSATHVLHLYFYKCNTCVGYAHALHVGYTHDWETCVYQMFYTCITQTPHALHKYHTCNT